MTAEIVFRELQAGHITLDTPIYISEHAWRAGGALASGSSMFAQVNTHIRVEDLIRGLVVQSGNDAAIALAEGIAGAEESFAAMMNARARELGLKKSTFANPWGQDAAGQRVSAREMAILAEHVIAAYPEYYHYFGEKEFTWNKIRQMNRNPLLFLDVGADGLKTGNIDDSGFNLVGSAVQNGQRLIVVIMGAKTAKERAEEARRLLNWGFHAFERKILFKAGDTIGQAKVFGGEELAVPLVADEEVSFLEPRGANERLSAKIVYAGPLPAPLDAGVKVARLRVMRGSTLALDIPLKTAQAVAQGGLPQRARDALWELSVGLFTKYVLHKPAAS